MNFFLVLLQKFPDHHHYLYVNNLDSTCLTQYKMGKTDLLYLRKHYKAMSVMKNKAMKNKFISKH